MVVARLCVSVASLGVAVLLGYQAYISWMVLVWAAAQGGASASLQVLGVTMPFSVGMTLLVSLALAFAFLAVYALFVAKLDD